MKKATIYDFARMCKFYKNCDDCPLAKSTAICQVFIEEHPDRANEIILNWCKEHPVETRQSKFLRTFPNACMKIGVIDINPCAIDKTLYSSSDCWNCAEGKGFDDCEECRQEYWLAEVEK